MTSDSDNREADRGGGEETGSQASNRTASGSDGEDGPERTAPESDSGDRADTSQSDAGTTIDSAVVDRALRDKLLGRESDQTGRVSTDRLFELLAPPGNRFVLTYVLSSDDAVDYAELVEYVVERTETPTVLTDAIVEFESHRSLDRGTVPGRCVNRFKFYYSFRGQVAATLINQRLPELEAAGLVAVDSAEQRISTTPATVLAAPHLALSLSELIAPQQ